MLAVHPQYITDTAGKKLVVLPLKEFDKLMEHLDDLEDVRLFDEAKRNDDGTRISFADYLKKKK
jgi:PHD/YefM family antitoxin component YafN of YafNO toxin-antitoxin module